MEIMIFKALYMVEEKQVEAVQQEQEQEGATMIEYALLVAFIAIIALAALRYLGVSFRCSSLTFHRLIRLVKTLLDMKESVMEYEYLHCQIYV